MSELFLYNTLSRKKELFVPISRWRVGLYTCGPTVYNYAHIGNLRTYLFEDFLRRTLEYNGYRVRHVMNITDVGHLTGDRDMGEDKVETGAAREGKSAWEITDFYAEAFRKDLAALNILEPKIWCKATDSVPEQIAMIKKLEKKGFAYKISDGVYFNTAKFTGYNKLSHLPLEDLKEGARVEKNDEKINPTDFALWKFSQPTGPRRQMEWKSPWGVGFPGWHIECSAMSLKYLGRSLDIHCGGIDHINIHHTNEIAQSEAATGKPFFNYWLHGAFLSIKGGNKMAKSSGSFLTLSNLFSDNNYDPLAYRFAALQTHYHKPMVYSPDGLEQAVAGLKSLRSQIAACRAELRQYGPIRRRGEVNSLFKDKFLAAINDDLNMPQALAVVFEVLKSSLRCCEKLTTVMDFDRVLGLDLGREDAVAADVPPAVKKLAQERSRARKLKDWDKADSLRHEIEKAGYSIEDGSDGGPLIKKQ